MIVYTEHCVDELPIIPGEFYRHFEGGLYRLVGIAKDAHSGAEVVVYQEAMGGYAMFVCPLDEFRERLDLSHYPNAPQTFRFELVKEIGW